MQQLQNTPAYRAVGKHIKQSKEARPLTRIDFQLVVMLPVACSRPMQHRNALCQKAATTDRLAGLSVVTSLA
jgi:hypothetical protein